MGTRKLNVRYNDIVADYLKRLKFCSVDGTYNPDTLCALCEKEPAARVYVSKESAALLGACYWLVLRCEAHAGTKCVEVPQTHNLMPLVSASPFVGFGHARTAACAR